MFEHREHGEKTVPAGRPPRATGRTAHGLLALQALAGNTAVTMLVQRSTAQEGHPGSRPNIELGDSGPGVALLQRQLGLTASGQFDQATHNAVVAFQQNHEPPSLHPATGGVGPLTWRALDERAQTSGAPQGQPGARPPLELGNTGQGVSLLQRLLGLSPTAVFDKATEHAVIAFQQARPELHPATGGVGPMTWNALDNPTTGQLAVNGKVLASGRLNLSGAGTALSGITEVARGTVTMDGVALAGGATLMVYSGGGMTTTATTAGTTTAGAAAATDVASTSPEAIALARKAQMELIKQAATRTAQAGATAAPAATPPVAIGFVAQLGVAAIGMGIGFGIAMLPVAIAYGAELATRTDDNGGLLLPGGLPATPATDPGKPGAASLPGTDGGAPAQAPGLNGDAAARLPGGTQPGAAIAPGQSGGHLSLSGLHIPLSDRRTERLGNAENAEKWTDLSGRDRTSLGKAYNHIVQTLVRQIAGGGRATVLHYVNVTEALINQHRAAGGRLLITEGRLNGGALRFDIAEINFDTGTVELIDLTAISDPAHAGKTGEYMSALQSLTKFPVTAYEGRYVNDDKQLSDEIVIVPVGSK